MRFANRLNPALADSFVTGDEIGVGDEGCTCWWINKRKCLNDSTIYDDVLL